MPQPKKDSLSSAFRIGRVVFVMGLACIAAPVSAGTETARERVGAFMIEIEHWTRDGVPIMHSPSATFNVRLIWKSSDGRVEATLDDDGYSVKYGYTLLQDAQSTCLANQGLFPIGEGPSDGRFWRAQVAMFGAAAHGCTQWDDAVIAGYQDAMRAALPDAPAAIDLWKARSLETFKSTRRCLEFEFSGDPFFRPCKTFSDQTK